MTAEPGILLGRLPVERRYEPLIVTTLRRWQRRRAPASLLRRLAGGEGDWRRLNEQWGIDGTVRALPAPRRPPPPDLAQAVPSLSPDEVTILIGQVVHAFVDAGEPVPLYRLRRYFAMSVNQLERELKHLRSVGAIPALVDMVDVDDAD